MKRFTAWVLLVGLGAGGMYFFERYREPEEAPPPARTRVLDLSRDGHAAAGAPSEGDSAAPVPAAGPESDEVAPAVPAPEEPDESGVVVLGAEEGAAEAQTPADAPNPLDGADASAFQEAYDAATKALASGDARRGLDLYRVIFAAARERADLDVSVVARKLLEAASDDEEKLRYYRYLATREPASPEERFLVSLTAGKALAAASDAESVRSAWELLSDAYLAARSPEERRQALDVLEPFITRHVFSRRSSPLLVRHRVMQDEHLSGIADTYRTTVDAVRRLNGIGGTIIRPGQRLLVLPGKSSIRVDKSEFRLTLFIDGKFLIERPVGLGADDTTPAGRFVVDARQTDPTWYPVGKAPIPSGDPRNILGSRWLGFRDTDQADGLGIHGTPDESSVGRAISSGCIRLRNADVELLYDFVTLNTEVVIEE